MQGLRNQSPLSRLGGPGCEEDRDSSGGEEQRVPHRERRRQRTLLHSVGLNRKWFAEKCGQWRPLITKSVVTLPLLVLETVGEEQLPWTR